MESKIRTISASMNEYPSAELAFKDMNNLTLRYHNEVNNYLIKCTLREVDTPNDLDEIEDLVFGIKHKECVVYKNILDEHYVFYWHQPPSEVSEEEYDRFVDEQTQKKIRIEEFMEQNVRSMFHEPVIIKAKNSKRDILKAQILGFIIITVLLLFIWKYFF